MSKIKKPALKIEGAPKLFKALSEPNRLQMLEELGKGPARVQDVAKCCDLDLSVVSRHLALMKDAGILDSAKKGKEVTYSMKSDISKTLRSIADFIENCCDCSKGKGGCENEKRK